MWAPAKLLAAGLGVRATVTQAPQAVPVEERSHPPGRLEGLGTFIELEAVAQAESDLVEEHRLIMSPRSAVDPR